MKLKVQNLKGAEQGEFEVKFPLVTDGRGTQAVHDTVVAYYAAQRSGTACTKTAGEVAGTNKKPWKQKGTGRARAGSFQSPLWRGGGVVFGPRPRDFRKKVSRGTRQLAMRKALSERLNAGDVIVVDEFKLASSKTRDFVSVLAALKLDGSTLIVAPCRSTFDPCLAQRPPGPPDHQRRPEHSSYSAQRQAGVHARRV